MRELSSKNKKGMLGPVISVFVMVLVISILAGLTFLFVSQLKTNVETTTLTSRTVTNESGAWLNATGYTLDGASLLRSQGFSIVAANNGSSGALIPSTNYTVTSAGVVNQTAAGPNYSNVTYTYTHSYIGDQTAYLSVNDTEAAGVSVVSYLSLIFLALIFGAILTLVLKIILPYINLGNKFGGF